MHKLLNRLIRKNVAPDLNLQPLQPLLEAISAAFEQCDDDRVMLEQSLTLTSDELNEINRALRAKLGDVQHYREEIEIALSKQNALLDASQEAVFAFKPGGALDRINRTATEFMGLSREVMLKNSGEENLKQMKNRLLHPEKFDRYIEKLKEDPRQTLKGEFESKEHRFFQFYTIAETLEGEYIGRVWCIRDITEMQQHQDQLTYHANHDSLTGLPNRLSLSESLSHALELAKRHHSKVAVLFIDLDDFKKINDTAGHEEGDIFLYNVSRKIKHALRDADILGRLGGDEFLIILEDFTNLHQLSAIHRRILAAFEELFIIKGSSYSITCSIGMSTYPNDGDEPKELIRKADMAMYQAKRNGKNQIYFYDESLERKAIDKVSIEYRLKQAISQREFILHYQPKISLSTGFLEGVEALVRWQPKDEALKYPDAFIRTAEDMGLITQITQQVIEMVCQQINLWRTTALNNTTVSINFSALDFSNAKFIDRASALISEKNIRHGAIEFELTESALFDDIEYVKRILARFKKQGIKVSIDDFGTGYSSFGYLQDLDIDFLKIDKSFVKDLQHNEKSRAIVKSIVNIGNNLGFQVVAEGIESAVEFRLLNEMGCHIGQGYFMSRPVPADLLPEFIKQLPIRTTD